EERLGDRAAHLSGDRGYCVHAYLLKVGCVLELKRQRCRARRGRDAATDHRVHEFVRLLLSHQGKVRPLRSMKRRPARPRLRSTVSVTNGMLSSIESVAAEVPMSVRIQPGATSKSARGSPAWRAEKHFISMLRAALLEL